jgi:hypothetical protein
MENLTELSSIEMMEISGGVNVAYELGYAIGNFLKKLAVLKFISDVI